jgi:hypothetical protein
VPAEGFRRGVEFAGLGALGLVVCCGLPLLLSVGAGITIVGLGMRSWLLGLVGLDLAVAAGLWRRRRRARCAMPSDERREG